MAVMGTSLSFDGGGMPGERGAGIQRLFEEVGGGHGFDPVSAGFRPFKEFKVQWQRNGRSAAFQVTDYLRYADQDLLREFADRLFERIEAKGKPEIYTPNLKEWLRSRSFVESAQPMYLRRSQNLAYSDEGSTYDLSESYDRLKGSGLVRDHDGLFLTWTKRPNHQRVGYCSALMRVIAISSVMDSARVPELVTDYVLYHELLHMEDGLSFSNRHHGSGFRQRERRFPGWEEAERTLRTLAKEQRARAG